MVTPAIRAELAPPHAGAVDDDARRAIVRLVRSSTPVTRPFSLSTPVTLTPLDDARAALPRALGKRQGDVGRDRPGRPSARWTPPTTPSMLRSG